MGYTHLLSVQVPELIWLSLLQATAYVNCILAPKGGGIEVDLDKLTTLGITRVVCVNNPNLTQISN